uniref:Uncharacterized protein n=1 Tax=Strigamia maritima TaxID=126957 RepID=T1J012_STRMM
YELLGLLQIIFIISSVSGIAGKILFFVHHATNVVGLISLVIAIIKSEAKFCLIWLIIYFELAIWSFYCELNEPPQSRALLFVTDVQPPIYHRPQD